MSWQGIEVFGMAQAFCGNQRVNRMESSAAENWLVEIQVQVRICSSQLALAGAVTESRARMLIAS